jgi:inner membrane protein
MSIDSALKSTRLPRRSMGLKLLLVCFLALLMAIPAIFVWGILAERTGRARQVTAEVSRTVGGAQTFLGPVLAVPYAAPGDAVVDDQGQATGRTPVRHGVYVVFPVTAQAQVRSRTEERRRSLFKVPVYHADLDFTGRFDLTQPLVGMPQAAVLDWTRAELIVGVSDPRGARSDIQLTASGRTVALAPSAIMGDQLLTGDNGGEAGPQADADGRRMRFFGTPASGIARPGAGFAVRTAMRFSGAERLAVLANGKTTRLTARSDWNDPSFDGAYLPATRQVGQHGFVATWSVPFIARGVAAAGTDGLIAALGRTSMGVSFVQPANPYQSVARALKYAPLFIGLVFLTYFLLEAMSRRRMHPAQYLLVGLAQSIFYLLLLSIAEQTGFDTAFMIAATATVALVSAYAGWVFESVLRGVIALIAFSCLYGLIYVLLRLEDYALLLGAGASFTAITAVMYFTRRIDWYGGDQAKGRTMEAAS